MTAARRLGELSFDTIRLAFDGPLLLIEIHRPEVLNAISPEVIAELRQVFNELHVSLGQLRDDEPDWSVRGVMLTGAGAKSFVAGADISRLRDMDPERSREYAGSVLQLTSWIETLPVPVVAAVNGFALGGGCELAMACDYIYASENASFGQPEVALGLIPGFGGTVRLTQYVGIAAARELILTGRRIDAGEALRLGLVARVLPDIGALHEAALDSLRLVLAQSPKAVAAAKRTIRDVRHLATDEALQAELDAFSALFGSADMVEGTTAFLEKRKPEFPGR